MRRFLKVYCKPVLKCLALVAVLIFGFIVAHNLATAERGYNAIGGEIMVFLLPVLWWAKPSIKDIKGGAKNGYK